MTDLDTYLKERRKTKTDAATLAALVSVAKDAPAKLQERFAHALCDEIANGIDIAFAGEWLVQRPRKRFRRAGGMTTSRAPPRARRGRGR